MKKYIKIVVVVLISLIQVKCIDQIELNKIGSTAKALVIEAVVTTELKRHQFKLSYSYNLDEDTPTYPQNAIVTVTDSDNNSYVFAMINNDGLYESTVPFQAESGKTYTLQIDIGGTTYTSTPEKINGQSNIESINVSIDEDSKGNQGLLFNVKSTNLDNEARFFKYEFSETFRIVAPYWVNQKLVVLSRVPFQYEIKPDNEKQKICYVNNTSKEIILHDNNEINSTDVNFNFLFYKKDNFKINERYSILLSQRTQSLDAHNYYKALKKISSSDPDEVFTDIQPGNINNNITINNQNKAVGYFEVSHVSSKRIFINYEDFFTDGEKSYIENCRLSAPSIFGDPFAPGSLAPIVSSIDAGDLFYKLNVHPIVDQGPLFLTSKGCGDCRKYGTPNKPNFWID